MTEGTHADGDRELDVLLSRDSLGRVGDEVESDEDVLEDLGCTGRVRSDRIQTRLAVEAEGMDGWDPSRWEWAREARCGRTCSMGCKREPSSRGCR